LKPLQKYMSQYWTNYQDLSLKGEFCKEALIYLVDYLNSRVPRQWYWQQNTKPSDISHCFVAFLLFVLEIPLNLAVSTHLWLHFPTSQAIGPTDHSADLQGLEETCEHLLWKQKWKEQHILSLPDSLEHDMVIKRRSLYGRDCDVIEMGLRPLQFLSNNSLWKFV
jgi:hypothetical protein